MPPAQKLKVALVITKSNWGGAQRYVFDVATRLPADRYDVCVALGGDGLLAHKLRAHNIRIISLPELERDVNPIKDWKTFSALYSLFKTEQPDVVHLNSSKIGGLGALAARLARVHRIIFTAHGWAFNEDRSMAQKLVIKVLYWITLLLSHETLAVSDAMKSQAAPWPFVGEKMTVVRNGIQPDTGFSKGNARLELTRRFPALKAASDALPRSAVWIGTIAELHPVKGHEYAIRALKDLAGQVIYVIMSDGQDRAKLEELIVSLGLHKTVFLLGHVDHAAEYIPAFDIFLLASLSEALGYVLLEAGAAGVPVVATAVGGIPEVVTDMESGVLVQPKNARELSHALSFMIEHPDDRKKYGAALKKKVVQDFSLEKMMEEIEFAYVATKKEAAKAQ